MKIYPNHFENGTFVPFCCWAQDPYVQLENGSKVPFCYSDLLVIKASELSAAPFVISTKKHVAL